LSEGLPPVTVLRHWAEEESQHTLVTMTIEQQRERLTRALFIIVRSY